MNNWFEVDKAGLAALTARRDKSFLFAELLSNAWDAPGVTRVDVICTAVPGRPEVTITVVDDSPTGFTDLSHAFTLFAESDKRADPEVRGRFNLGEKLSLALAKTASITTTTGRVVFDERGRHRTALPRTEVGSKVSLTVPMTRAELDQAAGAVHTFIPPVPTHINGELVPDRHALASFTVRLPTEIRGEDGNMRRTERQTEVRVYAPPAGQVARLYELGIPVCDTGDTFDVDIRQKVPLSLERESVTDAYLRRMRAAVLANCASLLDEGAAKASWVSEALETDGLPPAAVAAVIQQRYGERVASYDPSDPEANSRAVAQGYQVVHGGSFSGAAWASIRGAGAMKPAGQVTPTAKPWAEDGRPVHPLTQTPGMRCYAAWCRRVARQVIGQDICVEFFDRFNDFSVRAAYGGGVLQFAYNRLGKRFFEGPVGAEQIDLLIHELGHHYASDHLSETYYRALTRIGAKLALAAAADPGLLLLMPEEDRSAAAAPA
jgi:hypothetical protein